MNLQFVSCVYGLLGYLTSYMCIPKYQMSEPTKKALNEAFRKDDKRKRKSVGKVFKTKREWSLSEVT